MSFPKKSVIRRCMFSHHRSKFLIEFLYFFREVRFKSRGFPALLFPHRNSNPKNSNMALSSLCSRLKRITRGFSLRQGQTKLLQPFTQYLVKPLGIPLALKGTYEVVGIST